MNVLCIQTFEHSYRDELKSFQRGVMYQCHKVLLVGYDYNTRKATFLYFIQELNSSVSYPLDNLDFFIQSDELRARNLDQLFNLSEK